MAMELLYRHAGMAQREIGAMMGADYSTVSVSEKEASGHAAKRPDASGALQRPGGRLSSRIKI
jgi:hypothetical protein